jgi:hypothetical protein
MQANLELDLENKQYDMKTLKQYIYALCFFRILKTQKIDEDFAVNYILNPDYQMTREEELITINDVLEYQPHLKREKFEISFRKYDPDAPSFEKAALEK